VNDFEGKVAVVTGAGSGMGRAFAQRSAEEGMKLVLGDIEQSALDKAVEELSAGGFDVVGVPTDVSKREAIQHLADVAIERYGKLNVAFNNAGVEGFLDGGLWEATQKDWEWTMGVNLWSVIYGTQIFLPLILAQDEEGYVVNTCSMTSVVRAGNMYGVAKQAIFAISETLYGQLQAYPKVGVTALCPGIIATRLFQGSRNRPTELQNEERTEGQVRGDELRARMHERLSQGMPPSEVAAILFAAIRENKLYVLTDHDWDDGINQRHDDIMNGRNPEIAPNL
jgi:NAD(P)-dependent dehydrogenase (short-subunit alcohol dehydrogenase family)